MAGKKDNYNKSGAAARRKQEKKFEAMDRQNERDKRTALEQYQLIQERPGESKKEAMKLLAELA
jgi:hypothetical protein